MQAKLVEFNHVDLTTDDGLDEPSMQLGKLCWAQQLTHPMGSVDVTTTAGLDDPSRLLGKLGYGHSSQGTPWTPWI